MSILNLNAPQGRAPRNHKTTKIWLGVGLLVAVLGIGSTFAANISLNNGQAAEFGQGVQSTAYCGGNAVTLTVTPFSTFKNSTSSPTFYTTGFRVTGIPVACNNSDFNINFYDSNTATPQSMYSSYPSLVTATVAWFDTSTALTYTAALPNSLVFPMAKGGTAGNTPNIDTATATGILDSTKVTATGAFLSSTSTSPAVSAYMSAYIANVTSDGGSGLGGAFSVYLNTDNNAFSSLLSATTLSKIVVTTQNEVFDTSASLKPCSWVSISSRWSCSATFGLTYPGETIGYYNSYYSH
jgi:hypothetical protein